MKERIINSILESCSSAICQVFYSPFKNHPRTYSRGDRAAFSFGNGDGKHSLRNVMLELKRDGDGVMGRGAFP